MKSENTSRIAAEIAATDFFDKLPVKIRGFTVQKIFAESAGKFNYFSCVDAASRRSLTAYFHEETLEYKVRVQIGLTEFCLTNFFTGNFNRFTDNLHEKLDAALENLAAPVDPDKDLLLKDIKLADWKYAKTLPEIVDSFKLFLTPDKPVKITNGAYIILNYSDFDNASDFTIYYNAYTEKFSGESRIKLVPHVSYIFDAESLKELESKLEKNLMAELHRIRKFY